MTIIITITQEIYHLVPTSMQTCLFVNTPVLLTIPPVWQVITVLLPSLVPTKDIVILFLSMRKAPDTFPGPPIHCSTIILCGEQVKVTVVPSATVSDSGVNYGLAVA